MFPLPTGGLPPFDLPAAIARSGKRDAEIAAAIGCAPGYVWALRRGKRQPSVRTLFRLACVLGEFELAQTLACVAATRVAS